MHTLSQVSVDDRTACDVLYDSLADLMQKLCSGTRKITRRFRRGLTQQDQAFETTSKAGLGTQAICSANATFFVGPPSRAYSNLHHVLSLSDGNRVAKFLT